MSTAVYDLLNPSTASNILTKTSNVYTDLGTKINNILHRIEMKNTALTTKHTDFEQQISTLDTQVHTVTTSFEAFTKTAASTQASIEQQQITLNTMKIIS